MKAHVNITVDNYILEEAKKRGVNISETCERAICNKVNPANMRILESNTSSSDYPFEVCSEILPEVFKTRLYGMCGIKARRCRHCDKVFFVNDLAHEFVSCKSCSNSINRIEIE